MTRRLAPWAAIALATIVVGVAAGPPATGSASPVALDVSSDPVDPIPRRSLPGDDLVVVDQTFHVPVDGVFDITLALPADVDPADFDADAVLVVTSHRSIADRGEMHRALDGSLTRTEDTFDVALDPEAADPNLVATAAIDGGGSSIAVRIPTESLSRTPDALQLAQNGVHPIVLELRVDDRPAGEVTTYLHRLPSVPSTAGPMSVAFVMRQMALPTIESDGTITAGDHAVAELVQLDQVLAALDAAPATAAARGATVTSASVPRGVLVEPSLLGVVASTDADLATTLLPALAASDLLATPWLPFDPSAAARADQTDRYGTWLRRGEDLLGALASGSVVDRSIALVDDRLSSSGASLHRTLGTRMLVMPYDFYADLEGSLFEFTDISQLVTVTLDDGSLLNAAIVDDFLGNQMVQGADTPERTAIEIAAELAVLARDIDIDGGAVERHGVVLALPDMGIPDATLMAELAPLLLASPSLRIVEPRSMVSNTTTLLNDGRLVEVELPAEAGPDLAPRLARLDEVADDVLAYASMLPVDSPDITRWSETLDVFPSTALTEAQVDDAVTRLESDFADLRDAIVVTASSFTLTGKDSKLRFTLTNTSDTTLTVRVSLSSPKIRFPDGEQLVELPPRAETNVVARAEALSNGKSSVFLRLYAPALNRDVELAPEIVLTARVNSLAGLGQLLSGAGALLVLTWWAHHTRAHRRKQAASRHASRHPSSRRSDDVAPGSSSDATAAGGRAEISPDAAATSLPPS